MNFKIKQEQIATMRSMLGGLGREVNRVVSENQSLLLEAQKDQWLLGRNSDGESFTPTYTNDSYFKSMEAAKAYKAMKVSLEAAHKVRIATPINYPDKDSDTPNLIVTGPFQDGAYIRVDGDKHTLWSGYEQTAEISAKYGNKVFGFAPLTREYFWKHYMRNALIKYRYDGL